MKLTRIFKERFISSDASRSTESVAELWRRQLLLQTRVTIQRDLALFRRLPGWAEARHVLDAGCGSGHFLEALIQNYREKYFCAVDKDEAMLHTVRRLQAREDKLTVVHSDIQTLKTRVPVVFDFVIARLLIQHLPSFDMFFESIAPLLRRGGRLLILDAQDSSTGWSPALPSVDEAMRQLDSSQASPEGGRNRWDRLAEVSRKRGMVIEYEADLNYCPTSREEKIVLHDMFSNLGHLMEHHFHLPFDRVAYHLELKAWLDDKQSRGQFGMKALLLRSSAS